MTIPILKGVRWLNEAGASINSLIFITLILSRGIQSAVGGEKDLKLEEPPVNAKLSSHEKGRILFRVDSGQVIGAGHIVRSLVLAQELRERGFEVEFASRDHRGHLLEKIRTAGFRLRVLPPPKNTISQLSTTMALM